MASTSIVFSRVLFKPQGTQAVPGQFVRAPLVSIEVDCTISEQHSGEMEVTDHPVESGTNITDHVRRKPETLTVEGIVTDTPILSESERNAAGPVRKGEATRSKAAFLALRALRDSGQPVTVVTPLNTYDSMVMTSLVFPRDAETGEAIKFTAQFKEIRTVDSQKVKIVLTSKPSGQPKNHGGDHEAKEVTPKQSILDALINPNQPHVRRP